MCSRKKNVWDRKKLKVYPEKRIYDLKILGCSLLYLKEIAYSVMKTKFVTHCNLILHGTYGNVRRTIQHHLCFSYLYNYPINDCMVDMDLRCSSISEPFDYQGHKHPLYE
ncbi:hypothetical protein HID58_060202, partial [Brassica napus]